MKDIVQNVPYSFNNGVVTPEAVPVEAFCQFPNRQAADRARCKGRWFTARRGRTFHGNSEFLVH
jgi:hypothetical protein